MKQIVDNLASLGRTRLITLGVVGAAIVAAVVLGLGSVMAPTYVPLYSQLSPAAASSMSRTLEQAGIRYELSEDGMTVRVADEDQARARMALADSGLPSEGVPGWELFDEAGGGLGMNSFLQQVNRLRALEGELARSIQTIDGIDAARVHLVLPEREAFSRSRPEPSASVIVRSRMGNSVSRRQALSIRALVSSAVADLSGSRVTVLSASGETILGEEGMGGPESTLAGTRAQIEERMARNVAAILNARVGAGNARVQVNVDLTTEREVRVSRSYDPDQQVARSVETRSEDVQERDSEPGTVDVGNNIPEALQDAGDGAQNSSSRNRNDEIINYEIGSVESETVREPGEIERVSVAVLVNGMYEAQPGGGSAYVERSPEELERLSALVRSAIGYDETRGDSVQIDSLQFVDYGSDLGDPVGQTIGDIVKANFMTILRSLFALAVIAIIMIFGSRPLRQILDRGQMTPALAGAEGMAPALAGDTPGGQGAVPQLGAERTAAPPEARQAGAAAGTAGNVAPDAETHYGTVLDPVTGAETDMVRLDAVQGEIRRQKLHSIGALVDEHPDEALHVLNSWLAQS